MTPINPILEINHASRWAEGPIDLGLLGSLKRFLRILFLFPVKRAFRLHFYWRKERAQRKAMARKLNGDILITGH